MIAQGKSTPVDAPRVYEAFGLHLRTTLDLPAPRMHLSRADWELQVDAAIDLPTEGNDSALVVADDQSTVFTVERFARIRFHRPSVMIQPARGLQAQHLVNLTTGSLTALLLAHTGQFVLHGSTLERNNQLVIICGHAGAGKSTQTAYMASKSWRFFADDVAPIQWHDGVAMMRPGYDRLRLRPDAFALLGLNPELSPPLYHGAQKRLVTPGIPRTEAGRPAKIAGVLILDEQPGFEARRLSGREAMLAILNLQHPAASLVADSSPALRIRTFRDCTEFVRSIPILGIRREKTPDNLARTMEVAAGLVH